MNPMDPGVARRSEKLGVGEFAEPSRSRSPLALLDPLDLLEPITQCLPPS
jgi:hypothetical protein